MTEDVKALQQQVIELQELLVVVFNKIDILTKENAELKHRLSKYEHPKNSNNSSIPPSKD